METYDAGSALLVEVEFKRQAPFGTAEYFDPTTYKLTLKDPEYEDVSGFVGKELTRHELGKYYYIIQTESTWMLGIYTVMIAATDPDYDDITYEYEAFILR